MTIRITSVALSLLAVCGYCQVADMTRHGENDSILVRLVDYMTGQFSSEKQAAEDTLFYDIRLAMVRIWHEREDGAWLYVEQAVAHAPDHPYRQRVYRVRHVDDNLFESSVYTMHDPLRFAGAWEKPNPLATFSPDSLMIRDDCAILLRDREDHFEGSTLGRLCPSSLHGASYTTSEVTIYVDRLISWDRGFDSNGIQIWGAETGGYIFKKVRNFPAQ